MLEMQMVGACWSTFTEVTSGVAVTFGGLSKPLPAVDRGLLTLCNFQALPVQTSSEFFELEVYTAIEMQLMKHTCIACDVRVGSACIRIYEM
jgi:hypothetical protein